MNSIHKFIKEKAGAVNHDLESEIHGKTGRGNKMLGARHLLEKRKG